MRVYTHRVVDITDAADATHYVNTSESLSCCVPLCWTTGASEENICSHCGSTFSHEDRCARCRALVERRSAKSGLLSNSAIAETNESTLLSFTSKSVSRCV